MRKGRRNLTELGRTRQSFAHDKINLPYGFTVLLSTPTAHCFREKVLTHSRSQRHGRKTGVHCVLEMQSQPVRLIAERQYDSLARYTITFGPGVVRYLGVMEFLQAEIEQVITYFRSLSEDPTIEPPPSRERIESEKNWLPHAQARRQRDGESSSWGYTIPPPRPAQLRPTISLDRMPYHQ